MKKNILAYILIISLLFINGCATAPETSDSTIDKMAEKDAQIAELQEKVKMLEEQVDTLKSGMQRLGNVFDRSTPEKVADLWAATLQNPDGSPLYSKNGALTYVLLSKEYQEEMFDTFKESWNSRGSSPWVESYEISDKAINDDGTAVLTLNLILKTSADDGVHSQWKLYMTKNENIWQITNEELVSQ